METAPKKTATKPATKKVAKKNTKQAQVGFEE